MKLSKEIEKWKAEQQVMLYNVTAEKLAEVDVEYWASGLVWLKEILKKKKAQNGK